MNTETTETNVAMRKFKNYLINPRFQLNFIFSVTAIGIGISLVFYLATRLFLSDFAEYGRELGLPPDNPFFALMEEQRSQMNLIFLITSIFVTLFVFMGVCEIPPYRGPLYRFRKHLDRMAETGGMDPVSFRKKDWFQELSESYNRQMSRLKNHDNAKK